MQNCFLCDGRKSAFYVPLLVSETCKIYGQPFVVYRINELVEFDLPYSTLVLCEFETYFIISTFNKLD